MCAPCTSYLDGRSYSGAHGTKCHRAGRSHVSRHSSKGKHVGSRSKTHHVVFQDGFQADNAVVLVDLFASCNRGEPERLDMTTTKAKQRGRRRQGDGSFMMIRIGRRRSQSREGTFHDSRHFRIDSQTESMTRPVLLCVYGMLGGTPSSSQGSGTPRQECSVYHFLY